MSYWKMVESWAFRMIGTGGSLRQLNNWRLIGGRPGIFWEDLDEDLSVLGLLEGRKGVKREICFDLDHFFATKPLQRPNH